MGGSGRGDSASLCFKLLEDFPFPRGDELFIKTFQTLKFWFQTTFQPYLWLLPGCQSSQAAAISQTGHACSHSLSASVLFLPPFPTLCSSGRLRHPPGCSSSACTRDHPFLGASLRRECSLAPLHSH